MSEFATDEARDRYIGALLEEKDAAQDDGHKKALAAEFARLGLDDDGESVEERTAGAGKSTRLRGTAASKREGDTA